MILSDEQLTSLVTQGGIVNDKKIREAAAFAKDANVPLYSALIEKGVATDEQLGKLIAASVKLPFIELSKLSIPEPIFHIVPEKVAKKQKAVAFAREADTVKVAVSDPGASRFFQH